MKTNPFPCYSLEDDVNTVISLKEFADSIATVPTLCKLLNNLMTAKHLTPPAVYHRAELDRQTFDKLISFSNPKRASKKTLLQVAIGLTASVREATELLSSCGFACCFRVSARRALWILYLHSLQ